MSSIVGSNVDPSLRKYLNMFKTQHNFDTLQITKIFINLNSFYGMDKY